jgi:hypothetical protein
MSAAPFTGSYRPGEVEFLLRPIQLPTTPLEERERLIQSGRCHYSEMIGAEDAPSRERVRLFRQCLAANGDRFAADLARLASALAGSTSTGELTLVSIARAGTPVGVLLLHWLRRVAPSLVVRHYSISVIRDRGADLAAIGHILARHPAASIRFIDGWTGKGTIARELKASIGGWTGAPGDLDPGLWVPLDVCGASAVCATDQDYLIPPSLLGGTISGLISRSVLLKEGDRAEDRFHYCVRLQHLRRFDLSRWFVDQMLGKLSSNGQPEKAPASASFDRSSRQSATRRSLADLQERHGIADPNRIKLGIGETVRVLLRRAPKMVILHPKIGEGDASIISTLAASRAVPVAFEESLEFVAVAVIDKAV